MTKIEFDLDPDLTPTTADKYYAARTLALAAQPDSQASYVAEMVIDGIVKTGRPGQIVLELIAQMSMLCTTDDGESTFYRPESVQAFQAIAINNAPREED